MSGEQWLRELLGMLATEDPRATVSRTRSGHIKVVLVNRQRVYVSGTPSCPRALMNTRALVRRLLRTSR